jgi:hypothetical protein
MQADGAATDVQLMRAAMQERRLNHRIEVTEECTEMLTTFFAAKRYLQPAMRAIPVLSSTPSITPSRGSWFVIQRKAVPGALVFPRGATPSP